MRGDWTVVRAAIEAAVQLAADLPISANFRYLLLPMELLYVTDPMCSWCWGFAKTIRLIRGRLAPEVSLRLVMGGLAKDSDEPMPAATRTMVQGAWDAVEAASGARFNRDFWKKCTPRRSTWPACRAVLAAKRTDPDRTFAYFEAMQRAYYLEARNPSDREVAIAVAKEQALDQEVFRAYLTSEAVEADLASDLAQCTELGARGFPSLYLVEASMPRTITRGWQRFEALEETLQALRLIV